MLDSRLLDILRCPETHQTLSLLSESSLEELNRSIAEGRITNQAGRSITSAFTVALVRQDGTRIYPVVDDIPVMLIDESISVGI